MRLVYEGMSLGVATTTDRRQSAEVRGIKDRTIAALDILMGPGKACPPARRGAPGGWRAGRDSL